MEQFLGFDVGGTGIKVGKIAKDGTVLAHDKIDTEALRSGGDFVENFIDFVGQVLADNPEVERVGIGIPGMLTKDRTAPLELPAIPEFDGVPLKTLLEQKYTSHIFFMENDANAAALGEYHFSGEAMPENFLFATLGTGVGGAAVMGGDLFRGADGNGLEIGHIVSHNETVLEKHVGKKGMMNIAAEMLKGFEGNTVVSADKLDSYSLIQAAKANDAYATAVFEKVGVLLGEAFVSTVRILDIKSIYIGGGLSVCFDFIVDSIHKTMAQYLSPYYMDELVIKRAKLGNDAGTIGAAALCFQANLVTAH